MSTEVSGCRAKMRTDWQHARERLHRATFEAGRPLVSPADSIRYMVHTHSRACFL